MSTTNDVKRPTTTSFTYLSCSNDHYDQVVLTDTVNDWLSDYIYISIYGELYSEFELSYKVEYHPVQNEKLTKSIPLNEAESVFGNFDDEFGNAFYSFRPWWSMHENKSIVMLADSPMQAVTFYLALDDYPLVYMADMADKNQWLDSNEMFSLQPSDKGYSDAEGYFGTYYIRVRPSYNIADPLVDTPYSYYFRAFSQPAGDGLTDLYHNQALAGVAYQD